MSAPADAAPLPRTTRKLPAVCAVIASAVLLAGFDMARFLHGMDTAKPTLKRWLPLAAAIGEDDGLYRRHPDYLYPPFFLVALRPLTWMSPTTAAVLWQLAKYAALAGTFGLAWRLVGGGGRLPAWVKAGSVILSARFVVSDLGHGNVNLFIAFSITAAAYLLDRGRDLSSGLVLGLATAIKVTPALWGVYLIYKRRWRAVAGAAAGVVVAIEIVPLAVMPARTNHALLADWHRHVVRQTLSGVVYSPRINQSFAAVSNRLAGRDELVPGEPSVALIRLNPAAVRWGQRGVAVLLLAGLAWLCRGRTAYTGGGWTGLARRRHESRSAAGDAIAGARALMHRRDAGATSSPSTVSAPPDRGVLAVEWSLVAVAALLLSGMTWIPHFCVLVLAHVVVLAHVGGAGFASGLPDDSARFLANVVSVRPRGLKPAARQLKPAARWERAIAHGNLDRLVLILTLIAFGLCSLTGDILTRAGRDWALAHGLPMLGLIVLGAALAVVRGRLRAATRS